MTRRGAITGIGAVTPVGNDTESTWASLVAGRSGVGQLETFDAGTYAVRIAGHVKDFDVRERLPDPRIARRLSRSAGFAVGAALEALDAAGTQTYEPWERGVALGGSVGRPEPDELAEIAAVRRDSGGRTLVRQAPAQVVRRGQNTAAATIAGLAGCAGPVIGVSTACTASAHALGEAMRRIQEGDARFMLAGGCDALTTWLDVLGFSLLGALTTDHPDEPERASRPFDRRRSGFVLQGLPMDGYRTRLGGEVLDLAPPAADYRRSAGVREPGIDFALRAAEEAMADAGAALAAIPPERWGVVVGTCNAGLVSGREWFARRLAGEPADPGLLLLLGPQAIAEALSGALGLRGPCLSVNTACAAGAHALGQAADLIRSGHADAVLAGGTDAFSDILFSGFNALESLSPEPAAPYSRDRQGLSLGEGAGMLVVMAEDVALAAGARVRAELLGYGTSADGYHATAPHPEGEGAARAIRAGLDAAGVHPDDVGYVNTHGTGTAKNDVAETRANRRALGPAAHRAALSSTKSMVGHLLGAAGAVEGIVTVRALQEQVAPPTAGYAHADPECDLDYVPNAARALATDVAVSNNFAFGGANASLVIARHGTRRAPIAPALDRVVVTGLAPLTSAGCDAAALWSAWKNGRSCVAPEDGVLVGRVLLDVAAAMPARERRRLDRLGLLSVVAARDALADAGLAIDDENRHRVGVVVGTGLGPMESIERFTRGILEGGAAAASPAIFPNTVYNAAGGQVAMHVGAVGPAATVTAGHAAGATALCAGSEIVRRGRADAVIVVAADALTDLVIDGYRALGALGVGGFALAEAGIALVLERRGSALARRATIYGELREHAVASDALGIGGVDPDGGGAERAMRLALERSGISDVERVWSGITGHALADRAERAAIGRVLGGGARIERPKLLLGEPVGAGGALNAVLALLAWRHGDSHGPALVNSASLGGTSVSLLLTPND